MRGFCWLRKLRVVTRTHRDDYPLMFLRKTSGRTGTGVEFDSGTTITTRKRHAPSVGPIDIPFNERYKRRLILPPSYFSISTSFL